MSAREGGCTNGPSQDQVIEPDGKPRSTVAPIHLRKRVGEAAEHAEDIAAPKHFDRDDDGVASRMLWSGPTGRRSPTAHLAPALPIDDPSPGHCDRPEQASYRPDRERRAR